MDKFIKVTNFYTKNTSYINVRHIIKVYELISSNFAVFTNITLTGDDAETDNYFCASESVDEVMRQIMEG